ncbi:YrdB family protein [Microbispora sp. NPDC049125]|uniref:YrdB family protein n=1 Tax=Microbispora sp. NPDC049125 TaxID=3154929 RepID=UPI003465A171
MLTAAKGSVAALMFFLELGVLISVARWGFTRDSGLVVRILLGVGGPVVLATLWGLFAAGGRARHQLHGVARAAFETAWFGCGAAALAASGLVTAGVVFAFLYLADAALRLLWNQV